MSSPLSDSKRKKKMQEAEIKNNPEQELRLKHDRRVFTLTTAIKSLTHSRRKVHRRSEESPNAQRDWYHPRLFALVIGIMLMSIIDAFLTLKLLSNGAVEANPVMNYFLGLGHSAFIISKMIMTGMCVFVMTALSSYLFLNRFFIGRLITISFIGYLVLICYELVLLSA